MSASGTFSHIPTASSSRRVMASSSGSVDEPQTKADAPFLTRTGVLGITRITLVAEGKACVIRIWWKKETVIRTDYLASNKNMKEKQ
jgi:hypothetical protein